MKKSVYSRAIDLLYCNMKDILHPIKVVHYISGGIDCYERCPFSKDCANHTTSGEFRQEDGFTPDIRYKHGEKNQWFCTKKATHGVGALVYKDGRFSVYTGSWDY